MESNPESPTLASVLASLEAAVQHLDPADLSGPDERERARASLAAALSGVLALERRQVGTSAERNRLRSLVQALLRFVDARSEVAQLLALRESARCRQEQLQQATVGDLPLELELWTSGDRDRRVDWWSMAPLGPRSFLGAFGTVIGDEVDAGLVTACIRGALAVARKGIGDRLVPDRTLLVLHSALTDGFGAGIAVPALTFRLDLTSLELTVASAGHRSLWHVRDGVFQTVRARLGTPLGVVPPRHARPAGIILRPGDALVGFTGGTLDVEGPDGAGLRETDLRVALIKGLKRGRRSGAAILNDTLRRHSGSVRWAPQATVFSLHLP